MIVMRGMEPTSAEVLPAEPRGWSKRFARLPLIRLLLYLQHRMLDPAIEALVLTLSAVVFITFR